MSWSAAATASVGTTKSILDYYDAKKQEKKAKKLESELSRPDYLIPPSEKAALESAKAQASMRRLPNQSAIEGRLDQTTASKIAMLERLGGGGATTINAAARAYGDQMDAENELGVAAGNMYLRNQDIYRNELHNMGDYEMKQWDWDTRMPYEQKAAAVMALKEAAARNKRAARDNFFGTQSQFFQSNPFGKVGNMGGGGQSTPPPTANPYQTGIVTDPYQQTAPPVTWESDPNAGQQVLPGNQRQSMWDSWDYGGIKY